LREALGRYRDEKTVHKAVLRACDKPGIKNVRLRDLRHEATSKLLREGPVRGRGREHDRAQDAEYAEALLSACRHR